MCDRLVVGVRGSGAWNGEGTFIPLSERNAIIVACRYVDEVVADPGEDDNAWEGIRNDGLFMGSNY